MHSRPSAIADDGRTRDRVSALILEHSPQTATELAGRLGISPAAVRRHLDALVATGRLEERLTRDAHRGRGRPARQFHLTDAGRATFPHAYDDLALTALRYVAAAGGPDAVRAVAEQQLAGLEQRCSTAVEQAVTGPPAHRRPRPGPGRRPHGRGLRCHGLGSPAVGSSASTTARWRTWRGFPQLCEAETAVIGRLVGTHVQRLATIAHGDGICTTHIPGPHLPGNERPPNDLLGERAAHRTAAGTRTAPSTSSTPIDRERTPA